MLWKILFFDYVDKPAYSYARFAINVEQGTPSFDEIKDVLERSNFTQESYDSNVWFHPVGLGVSIDLDVDGCLCRDYIVITVDGLASMLPFVILGKELAGWKA